MNIKLRHLKYVFTAPIPTLWKISTNIIRSKILTLKKVKLEDELWKRQIQEPIFPNALFRTHMTGNRESADKICEHEFDILGSGPVKLGKNIDWQKDFSGRNEIKVPWELSRFQFLSTLIKAYETHSDSKYAEKAKELIRDWILKNPLGKGINWQSSMEAAIRTCNFSLAWFFLKNTPSWKDAHWQKTFLTSIVEHGKFILRNLEYGPGFNTNHLIGGLTGLLFLGILFPQFKEARKWKITAIKGLENEIKKQVYEDGVDFEASIPYHRLVCELFGISALLSQENEIVFSPDFNSRLEKMFEFVFYYTKPNGLAPQIGDSDDSRLFIFEDFHSWERRDHKHLFWLAKELFPLNNKFVQSDAPRQSRGFNYSKIYIMQKGNFYCIADCGDIGQNGNGGHAHNDELSFELNISGEDFIVDSGTFVYTSNPVARNNFRKTRAHNTVMIDNKEIHRFKNNTVFSMHCDAETEINKWDSNENEDILDAQYKSHRRVFNFDKKETTLTVTDYLNSAGSKALALEWNFHFDAGVKLQKNGEKIFAEKNGIKIKMHLPQKLAQFTFIHDDEISPRYGIKEKAQTLTIKLPQEKYSESFTFVIAEARPV